MKAIIEDFRSSVGSLFEVKIGMVKNADYLDNLDDFSGVTMLYQMNHESYEVINDIFFKLFPEEMQWGCQNVITAWRNLINAEFFPLVKNALNKHYQQENLDEDFAKLRMLADIVTVRYNNLVAA